MRMLTMLMCLFFTLDCAVAESGPQCPPPEAPPPSVPADPVEALPGSDGQNIVDAINFERRKLGLRPIRFSDQLTCASSMHAAWLFRNDRCQHTGPGVQAFGNRAQICGGSARGEVIACGQATHLQVVKDWLNELSHRDIIMDPDMYEMGAAKLGNKWVAVLNK